MSVVGAFIVPHPPLIVRQIGRGQEKVIQNTIDAYEEVGRRISILKPDVIVITTPHSVVYSDYFHISPGNLASGDFSAFGSPNVRFSVQYAPDFVEKLNEITQKEEINAGTQGERDSSLDHGTLVPLYFINQYYREYKLVRVSISGLPFITHYRFGQCIAAAARESKSRVVFVASGDLSHKLKADGPYGFAKEGPAFDRDVTDAMKAGDFLRFLNYKESFCEAAAECGLRSFIIMAGALDGKSVESELLSYEGPFGVGYAVAAFAVIGDDENRRFGLRYEELNDKRIIKARRNEHEYVGLARRSLEHYVKTRQYLQRPEGLSEDLINKKAGVFVSLKLDGQLRGCIGTITPTTECVADEIIRNAVSAGVRDPRFRFVEEQELENLVYNVDVLGDTEVIDSISKLDPKRYGVIVSSRGKTALLLPNLEGIDTPEEQVNIALRKGGILPSEKYELARFEVVRYE